MRGTQNVPSSYVVLRKGNKALFVLRSNTGYMDGYYGLPAGHVEDMENFVQAAVREVFEEVGVKVDPEQLKHFHTMHRNHGDHVRIDLFFEATKWTGTPKNSEPNRHEKIAWLDLGNLPDNVMDYTKAALERAKNKQAYSEFGWEAI